MIWLTEVAPKRAATKGILDQIAKANEEANPELFRIAMKMATGSGKTTVMAILIAWQAVNAARKDSKDFRQPIGAELAEACRSPRQGRGAAASFVPIDTSPKRRRTHWP